jgi:hypothetical protein
LVDDAASKHSEVRQQTMQNVINAATTLLTQAAGMLAKAQDSAGFQVPIFKLGPDEPAQAEDQPLNFGQQVTYTFNEAELIELATRGQTEHAKHLLRDAGKTEQDLEANPRSPRSLGTLRTVAPTIPQVGRCPNPINPNRQPMSQVII